MKELHDPRVAELEHLRLSLAEAAKHFDEFEARLERLSAGTSIRNLMDTETHFRNYAAGGAAKMHQPAQPSPEQDIENRFAAVVASFMAKARGEN
jgi:hypothetical protein